MTDNDDDDDDDNYDYDYLIGCRFLDSRKPCSSSISICIPSTFWLEMWLSL